MSSIPDSDRLVVSRGLTVPMSEFRFDAVRAQGPGGQNVNKVSSKVQLRWTIAESSALTEEQAARFMKRFGNRVNNDGELVIASQATRKQARNKARCLEKLAEMLAEIEHAPKKRRKTKRTAGSNRRRLAAKKRRSQKKALRGKPERE